MICDEVGLEEGLGSVYQGLVRDKHVLWLGSAGGRCPVSRHLVLEAHNNLEDCFIHVRHEWFGDALIIWHGFLRASGIP